MSQPAASAGTTSNSSGPAVNLTVTNPTDGTPTEHVTGQAESKKDESQPDAANWQDRYDGQLKVNRDLEGKLNSLRNGLASALGLEDKKASTDDLVAKLTESVGSIKHELLVERVARENKIDNNDDLDLIRGTTDEAAMRKLAARLAAVAQTAADGTKPKSPRPDGSAGNGTGKPTVKAGEAGKAEAARRFGDKGQNK